MTSCLYCGSNGPFSTKEHVIPESLGNDDLILTGEVCDACQRYFGKEVERYVLDKTPLAFWRTFLQIATKKGKLPAVDVGQPSQDKGTIPDRHARHDNIGFAAHDDGSISVDIDDSEMVRAILEGRKTDLKMVLTPKKLHMLGRFLGKVGLGILGIDDPVQARNRRFDGVRRYARYGDFDGLWPIFYYTQGRLRDLRQAVAAAWDGQELEEVHLYSYGLVEVAQTYTLFRFNIGIDNWVICLDDPFPHPAIREAFPGINLRLIWYDEKRSRRTSSAGLHYCW
ncbi:MULTISPECIES: HNH endonuclease [Acidobacterium]|uniref:HNH endonuclease 5 domain-containing protein n=1 Tax=Acidobacterium capsulatum (strain ATCC 51196 / DSM 11244 / BCRC 80197 / JCM 7670 / NBRC 15755 / NCIMB 13165 / 161) TaxID=240015 RepID=C1F552_ACIC5|nr:MULTISPECIES: HNH endonuclease [Acidobacterium]ACO32722.1 hypothetical protein ACP_3139 [Acidobacterium capsulatum ATCC 51196]HCT61167.1 hypothetical protein [Acidobacterium sp.]